MSENIEGGLANLIAALIHAAGGEIRVPRSTLNDINGTIAATEEDGVMIFRLEQS